MAELFDDLTDTQPPYLEIYRSLQSVRAAFHREGRISDANAKLDETVKFLVLHFAHLKGLISNDDYSALSKRESFKVARLNRTFAQVAKNPVFHRKGIGSVFGDRPTTVFRDGDEDIAFDLFVVARQAFRAQNDGIRKIDILNEAFGHHVRDNFRNHTEDAQYMTPPEVVDLMVDVGVELIRKRQLECRGEFIVADPSCGVGSFLTRWRAEYTRVYGREKAHLLRCVGQDKVDRMVRLSAINLTFSDSRDDDVFLGNSICDGSPICEFDGRVDLILTNPPFGARFLVDDLRVSSTESTPFFANGLTRTKAVDSEFLFIDRYLTLLRPGGVCLAIVPDGVVSAKGLGSLTRHHLARNAEVFTIIELPSVTFAQAGTRTKTVVLGFRKTTVPRQVYRVFFSEVKSLGFQVHRRSGVPIKKSVGHNQLPDVFLAYKCMRSVHAGRVDGDSAHTLWREIALGEQREWTPRAMIFDHEALRRGGSGALMPLRDLTKEPHRRRAQHYTEDTYFISVLHIIGECLLDIAGIKSYRPITPGLPVEAGEILVSRINPRIPRVAVVPDLGRSLLCSSEYEVLRARDGVSPYVLAFLLLDPLVQDQMQSLTAGTSASHSRIKPRRIYDVLIPRLDFNGVGTMARKLRRYEECCRRINMSLIEIGRIRSGVDV